MQSTWNDAGRRLHAATPHFVNGPDWTWVDLVQRRRHYEMVSVEIQHLQSVILYNACMNLNRIDIILCGPYCFRTSESIHGNSFTLRHYRIFYVYFNT